jgi:aminopeptidase N
LHDIVAVHELAHQWFSGMIASNESAHPFLDEGLAQWAALDFLRDYYQRPTMLSAKLGLTFGPFELLRAAYAARPHSAPSSLLPAERYTATTLAQAVYVRPALAIERIAERRGRSALTNAISRYARAQRFKHPTPKDLYVAFDTSLGSGWGSRTLFKALEGSEPTALKPIGAESRHTPSGWAFTAELWTLGSSLLGWLGP